MSAGYLIRKEDFPAGIATAKDLEKLAALLNPYLSAFNALTANGVTLTDNLSCEVQVGTFSHGVASAFSLKRLKSAKGCVVLGCDIAVPTGVSMRAVLDMKPEALPRVSVTILFSNPATVGAKVALQFLPEGQLFTGSTPAAAASLSWIAPTLLNGWVNTGGGLMPAGYMIDSDGFVHLRGFVNNGTSLATIFTLPSGFRPSAKIIFRGYGENPMGTPSSANVYITTAGNITSDIGSGGPGVSFDGISFDTRT